MISSSAKGLLTGLAIVVFPFLASPGTVVVGHARFAYPVGQMTFGTFEALPRGRSYDFLVAPYAFREEIDALEDYRATRTPHVLSELNIAARTIIVEPPDGVRDFSALGAAAVVVQLPLTPRWS
jgi:hypothetical protein